MSQQSSRYSPLRCVAVVLVSLLTAACTPEREVPGAAGPVLAVQIDHRVDQVPVEPGQTRLRTARGETVLLTSLRYYLSNFRLVGANGQRVAAAADSASDRGYFLIDESNADSRHLRVQGLVPGSYQEIEFLVGIDEARNAAGAQTGMLDPVRGMFWTWHTGYIFFALEGRAEPEGRALEFHVGGDTRYARTVRLPLPEGFALSDGADSSLHLTADIGSIFGKDPAWGLAAVHGAAEPEASSRLADAYGRMFRIDVPPTRVAGTP